MNDTQKKAMIQQQYAMTALLIMTITNLVLGLIMVAGFLPVEYGFILACLCMFVILGKVKNDLMGDERLWESPEQYRQRIGKKDD